MITTAKQERDGTNVTPAPPQPALSQDAVESVAAIAQLRLEAQAQIDTGVGTYQVGNYPASADRGEPQ